MPRPLAIATCQEYPTLLDDDQALVAALARRGVTCETVRWDEPRDWTRSAGVLLRSVWDYFVRIEEFRAWLSRLERDGVRCWNPVPLVRWNADKRYLAELEAHGVRIPPTLWIERGSDAAAAAERIRAAGWEDVVVKPTVSGGAWRTRRLARGRVAAETGYLREVLADGALLAQPFLPEVVADGEVSLLFFGGEFSHAVRKRARAGDFRVQWTHGGTHVGFDPPPDLVEQARAVLAAAPEPGLYARVDGILRDGLLVLMELEQIEPYLFLGESPGAAERLATSVGAALEAAAASPGPQVREPRGRGV